MSGRSMDPSERCALVTGGGSGIGRAVALELARAGARVAILGRRPEALESVVASILSEGGEAIALPCDLLREGQRKAALAMASSALGPIEILVNNAGIAPAGPLKLVDDATMDRVFDLNLRVPFQLARALVPGMREGGWGRIVNVASTAGLRGARYTALYTASKHALIGLTRSLAAELLEDGIRVNAVCPGFTDTELVDSAARAVAEKSGRSRESIRDQYAAVNPLGRLVTPAEVALSVLHLVGPASEAISGHALVIDGGTQPV